jgi:hypothetical protein
MPAHTDVPSSSTATDFYPHYPQPDPQNITLYSLEFYQIPPHANEVLQFILQSTDSQKGALLSTVESNSTLQVLLPLLFEQIKIRNILQQSINQLTYRLVEQGLESRLRPLMTPRMIPQRQEPFQQSVIVISDSSPSPSLPPISDSSSSSQDPATIAILSLLPF